MYCHHCEKKQTDDAVYCSQCGRLLADGEEAAATASVERASALTENTASKDIEITNEHSNKAKPSRRRKTKSSFWTWLAPIAIALVTAGSVFSYYIYQIELNDRVIKLQSDAKTEALEGKYEIAQELLQKASSIRPGYSALQKDAEVVAFVADLSQTLINAGKQLEKRQLAEAEQTLDRAHSDLKGHTEPIYSKVKQQYDDYTVKLEVMKLTEELINLNTIDELESKLHFADHLDGEEALAIKKQIVAKIVEISYKEAEALLKGKNFSDALKLTDRALTFAKDNEQMKKLANQINQAQSAYEKSEQRRLEQAMQQAAAEDLKNQTAAVEVVNIESTLDEFGDLNIVGELKNGATRPIYSINVEFIVYDAEGKEVGKGTTKATPDYVEPGEKITFTSTVYGVYVENTTVVVDHATWFLD